MVVGNIFAHARRMPDKTAVIYGAHQLCYREFAVAIAAMQRHLAALGLVENGVAVLAITSILDGWVAGLALRNLGITTIGVGSAAQLGTLGLPDIQCVVTSEIEHWPSLDALTVAAGWRRVSIPGRIFADLAAAAAPGMSDVTKKQGGHILLTSGTTGSYKKVLVDPDRLAIYASLPRGILELSNRSVFNVTDHPCWTGTGYYCPSITWGSGGTVVFQEVDVFAPLQHSGVTDAIASPWALVRAFAAPGDRLRRDDAMRLVVGGGPLSQSMADEIKARLTRQIYMGLGTTEVGLFALTPVEGPEDLRWHRVLPSREVQIVDDNDRILPAGREGLLRLRIIDGLTGYLHDDETSHTFFRGGYFYTGDLGVIGRDGRLALIGRTSDVVNVLGSKFAPGPIEEVVQREFGVSGVCVFSVRQADGEEVAHIAIESQQRLDLDRLARLLGRMLPGPLQLPVHLVDALPRNQMGKVQREILKQQLGLLGKVTDTTVVVTALGPARSRLAAAFSMIHRPIPRSLTILVLVQADGLRLLYRLYSCTSDIVARVRRLMSPSSRRGGEPHQRDAKPRGGWERVSSTKDEGSPASRRPSNMSNDPRVAADAQHNAATGGPSDELGDSYNA